LISAGVAQLVEHYLAKVNVTGSNPVTRSKDKYYMIYIAYRGLYYGEDPQIENTPNQVSKALQYGFNAMVDAWRVDGKLYLGSDQPLYEVSEKYLQNKRLWISCRNQDMYDWISIQNIKLYPHYFQIPFGPTPNYVTTNSGYYWTFQDTPINNQSIMAVPESYDRGLLSTVHLRCYGICSMFLQFIKRIRNDTGFPFYGDMNVPNH
jgi:hypothetical protein